MMSYVPSLNTAPDYWSDVYVVDVMWFTEGQATQSLWTSLRSYLHRKMNMTIQIILERWISTGQMKTIGYNKNVTDIYMKIVFLHVLESSPNSTKAISALDGS